VIEAPAVAVLRQARLRRLDRLVPARPEVLEGALPDERVRRDRLEPLGAVEYHDRLESGEQLVG
jgi:hypothetical protein